MISVPTLVSSAGSLALETKEIKEINPVPEAAFRKAGKRGGIFLGEGFSKIFDSREGV